MIFKFYLPGLIKIKIMIYQSEYIRLRFVNVFYYNLPPLVRALTLQNEYPHYTGKKEIQKLKENDSHTNFLWNNPLKAMNTKTSRKLHKLRID